MSRNLTVQFLPAVASACGPSSGDCGCGPEDAVDPNDVLQQRVEQLQRHFGDRVDVVIADYSSHDDIEMAIGILNTALERSGSTARVTPENVRGYIENVAPITAINGDVMFSRSVPPYERLREKVDEHLAASSV